MLKKITNFIKYHNAFVIAVALIFTVGVSAMAANEDLREQVLGEKIVTQSGIDNSRIMNANLDEFDFKMKIREKDGAMEDDESYYIYYQYRIIGIKDNVWQDLVKLKKMEVSKKSLAGRDLGLWVAEELGEVIDSELAYLKKVQEKENDSGKKIIKETTEYKGLLGLVIDTKTKELPSDYELVVKPKIVEPIPAPSSPPPADDTPPVDTDTTPPPPADTTTTTTTTPQCDGDNLNLCDTQDLCEAADVGGHWHNGQCYSDNPATDSAYYQWLKDDCLSGGDKFWYDDSCHEEDACEEKTFYLDADGDGFGTSETSSTECEQPSGYVLNDTDCDDGNAEINPNAAEVCDDGIDNNCDETDDVCDIVPVPDIVPVSDPDPVPDVCDSDNLGLCDTKDLCEGIDLHWYNDICNAEEEAAASPDPICDSDNLGLCDENNCETDGGGFWFDGMCNDVEE